MTDFSQLGLRPEVLQAVADTGYTTPTPIQEQAIPVALAGRDVLGIAQTGTGKTAAFTLPMIDRLATGRARARMPRSLVLEPTRELADQVATAFEKYAKRTSLKWALLIGGVSFDEQLKALDRGVDVLIATPGRLLDLFERGKLMLMGVEIMVVDEADRMLDMGFIPDIERIFKLTPPKRQTLFFSATMPPEITRLTAQFLKDPTRIEASRPATTAENIAQFIAEIPSAEPKAKRSALRALIERSEIKNAIVFCNRKTEVDVVAKSLAKHGLDASAIHGDLDQSQRTRTLEKFRAGDLKILVASDVAARGLDIPDVSHVFNYDVPHHAEDYVHRIGRTGRAGRSGETFMIVTPADAKGYDKVLKLIKVEPKTVSLDLDWGRIDEAAKSDGERRGRGRERGGERGRAGRDGPARDRTPRERSPDAPARAPREREEVAAEPARDERPPRESSRRDATSRNGSRRETSRRERPAAEESQAVETRAIETRTVETTAVAEPAASEPTSHRGGRGAPPQTRRDARTEGPARRDGREAREPREGRDDGPVGFGGDTPAFLMRAVTLPPAPPATADADA
jgi:superfamily II DNA/RNA helicase